MNTFERLRTKKGAKEVVALTAGALALSACSSSPSTAEQKIEPVSQTVQDDSVRVQTEYFLNGTRRTIIDKPEGSSIYNFSSTISEWCDGQDLMGLSRIAGYNTMAGSTDRTVDHPACDDGKLTESDFPAASAQ